MLFKKFFKGGTDLKHYKNTAELETIKMPVPSKVIIPMVQHIGIPCNPCVKVGELVKVGQLIGSTEEFFSVPVHSSVSGKIISISPRLYAGGRFVESIEIETDGKQELSDEIIKPEYSNTKEFLDLIKKSGLVGLGGAGFPTHIKLSPPKDKHIDTLIINGAECEPYITSDYREMIENPDGIINGIMRVCSALNINNAIFGIEDNKSKAIDILISKINEKSDFKNIIKMIKLKSTYPQGAEKMLIYSLTNKKVPSGKLPLDVGVLVMNVNTLSFIDQYFKTGMPLIKRKVTVDGEIVNQSKNVEVLIGTKLEEVFNFCGGFKDKPRKVLMGGPMMGIAQFSLESTIIKNTNCILAFAKEDADIKMTTACIRCGKCVDTCPMNLLPLFLNVGVIKSEIEDLKKYHLMDCIECGTCSYGCPAKIQLVQSFRLGKQLLNKNSPRR